MTGALDQLALFGEQGDAAARAAIATELGATLFVEAGAGTGKTAALVGRVAALVAGDGGDERVPMRAIAAITFTEKAAAELRDRIRAELVQRAGDPDAEPAARDAARAALDELDASAICTLHAFAQRLLTEFPVEAGLPPRIVVRDEISSRVAFETRWRDTLDEMLDDAALEVPVLVMLAAGIRLEHLRAVAEVLDDNWDLLDRIADVPAVPALDLDGWLTELDAVCSAADTCRVEGDTLVARLLELAEYGERIRGAFDDIERIRMLRAAKPSFRARGCGRKGNWPDVDAVRDAIARLGEARESLVRPVLDAAIRSVVVALAGSTERAVAARRVAGELEFHDLLVLARTLLRDEQHGPRVRRVLRARYRRILVDEFQDTDPIQVELAALLGSGSDGDGTRPWTEMHVDPGRLFFVGDPKQSIYRFRRADIATFLAASQRFAEGGPRFLTSNYRTAPGVLAWVNHVFAELIQAHPGSQPEYRALEAARPIPVGHAPGIRLLGVDEHDAAEVDADELRRREAGDVARAVQAAIAEQWPVFDTSTRAWRPARLGDVCILIPARTSLPFLEQALDDAGIAYRAETSSLVYASREIRDLLAALRAVDDPSDSLSTVTALRSSLFGCGDDDLFEYHVEHGGTWDVRVAPPESLAPGHPVAEAMRFLGALHESRMWSTPSELLERIVRERRVIEVGALSGRFRDVARRTRFLVDQARAFEDAAEGTLRDYLAWARLQGTEGARVVEAVLPETDDDAVRILTIHGAKGLEFPIVVCSGTTTAAQPAGRGVRVLFPAVGGYEVKLAAGVQTEHFELHQPVDEQMGFHEKLRLLYVACTRARDHLVVSVHRKTRDLDRVDRERWTHAELLWHAAREAPRPALEPMSRPARRRASATDAVPVPLDLDAWRAEHARAHAQGMQRGFVAATTLARRALGEPSDDPGLAKDPRDLELPPWNKGRYGTAIGRAVHATLQTVDIRTGRGVDDTAAAQAAAEGVEGHEATIAALVRSAIAGPSVRRAVECPHWREAYVAVMVDGITLEGYVDLLYRDDDGLVIVDYKTDTVGPDERATRAAKYRVQLGAYALAVAEATGEPVVRATLVFCDPDGAAEIGFAGAELAAAMSEARTLARRERDDPSPVPGPAAAEL